MIEVVEVTIMQELVKLSEQITELSNQNAHALEVIGDIVQMLRQRIEKLEEK